MRRLLLFLLFLAAAAAAPAGAAITFNAGAPMTTDASFTASQPSYGGGIILHVGGDFDTASVALEVSSWSIAGSKVWITADTCDAMTAAQVCRAAVGPADLRLTITGAGGSTSITAVGFEVQAVVASSGGTGAVTFDLVGAGTNANALLVGTGGTLAATGTGAITATAVPWSGITSSPFSYVAPDTIHTAVAAGGALAVRPFGGTGATDIIMIPPTISYSSSKLVLGSSVELWSDANHRVVLNNVNDFSNGFDANGFLLKGAGASATVPTFVPNRSDNDTGIGHDTASGGVSIIDESTEVIRAVSTYGMILGCKNFGTVSGSLPTGGAACDSFYDGDINVWCCYTTSWVQCADNTTGCS